MKAIYINLDPYLRAIVAGEPLPAPPSVPLAVTIPAGQTAALVAQTGSVDAIADSGSNVCGIHWTFSFSGESGQSVALAMSDVLSGETATPCTIPADVDEFTASAATNGVTSFEIPAFSVLLRRERASGPVDLIDLDVGGGGGGSVELTADAINRALGGEGASGNSPLYGVNIYGANVSNGANVGSVDFGDYSGGWYLMAREQ